MPRCFSFSARRKLRDYFNDIKGFGEEAANVMADVGLMIVNQFDSLGEAIGQSIAGIEGSLQNLGQTILQNLGNILIMAGMASGNIPLIIAGASIQLGQGIWKGLSGRTGTIPNSIDSGYMNSAVTFRISGESLVGVLGRQEAKSSRYI